jgi:hypothetical protein
VGFESQKEQIRKVGGAVNANALVIAVIRLNQVATSDLEEQNQTETFALESVGSKSRLAHAIDNARSRGDADVVVVLSDSQAVLAEANANLAVNRFVESSVSDDDAIAELADSDETFIDEDQEVEFVWFELE